MIIDRIKNIEYYETILPGLKNGLNTLRQLPSQEVGRYEFSDDPGRNDQTDERGNL